MTRIPQGLSNRDRAPYASQDAEETTRVITALNDRAKQAKSRGRGGFSIKKKTFTLDKAGHTVDSWMLQDWDYKKPNLPTYARGLFTHANNGKPEIAVRGYDKFFNVGEINKTQWRNVEHNTRGPYELSVKENGCIIFIAALDDERLIITSKHSTGPREDASANHAKAGEKWVDKHLASKGKSREDLAKTLRSMNATAVAELCDDEFEEHVLRYTPEQAGLYLHGINLNLPDFATYSGNLVANFADEWGFKQTMYVLKDDIESVKTFLEGVGETGNYDGRDTEGFVIRCQVRANPDSAWHDWFFKYKFEEPYLMYRQWRETTRAVISNKPPRFNKHKKITEEYLLYARRQLAQNPALAKEFNMNHGIIAMRDGFLKEKGLRGSDIIRDEADGDVADAVTQNVVLCPAATIGCGKTTVAIALTKLFDWGHEQNDNIQGKGNRPQRFVNACLNSLALHSAVIADRNNHQKRERQQFIDDIRRCQPDAKLVCLHWVHDRGDYNEIRKAMQERVLSRGDNHQTIQASSKRVEIIGVMDGFLRRFEPVNPERSPDDGFDLIVDLEVAADSRQNLQSIVEMLHDHYPQLFKMPTDEEMDTAVEYALNEYHPDIKHDLSGPGSKSKENKRAMKKADAKRASRESTVERNGEVAPTKDPRVEYFCVSVSPERINAILEASFAEETAERAAFYRQLQAAHRLQPAFHVTLMHRASTSQDPALWAKLQQSWLDAWKQKSEGPHPPNPIGGTDGGVTMGTASVVLENVVDDGKVMAIAVTLLGSIISGQDEPLRSANKIAHITIGTASDSIKPKESNDMLAKWGSGAEADKVNSVKIKGHVVLDGIIKGIVSR
ncbi:MAG: hypothetical protein M1828_006076 [Chrysothrix sp. TS-e1954]|nr:MAG: hypothetical protein M1828_006076 [Chrysothrix sp. TS-e1954]